MNLIVITAFIAVCGAAKLDRTYLPPSSAGSAGGSPGSLQAPGTRSSEKGPETPNFPTGSYTNDFGGVVVDAASPGTRTSEGQSGLGASRLSYGSTNSKVGDAAFRGSVAGFRGTPSFGGSSHEQNVNIHFDNHAGNSFTSNGQSDHAHGFSSDGQEVNSQIGSHTGQFSNGQAGQFSSNGNFENKSERPQAAKDRSSNILALSNDVNSDSYSYGFETDNGITVGENGVAVNGVQAEGGYSYHGDDGQVYKITYTADEDGYRPQGAHLPTPPPIPEEILKSLEQNAKEEAAGLVDDGSYDAHKYNGDGDYTQNNAGNKYNGEQSSQFGKRPQSVTKFNNQSGQAFGKPGSAQFGADSNAQTSQQFGVTTNANLASHGHLGQANGNKQTMEGNFGATSNAQTSLNGQLNGKPGSGQFGITGSQPSFGQSTQENNHKFDSNSALNGNTGSHSSHTSQSQSDHRGSSAPVFGQTGTQPSSSGQAQSSFGGQTQFGSQFNQHAESAQYGNQSPDSSSQQNHQGLNTQLSAGTANSHSSQPVFGSSFKPQGSEAFSGASLNQDQDKQDFGKPYPQTFSGQNFNRPSSAGNFNYNTPTFGQGQMTFGSAATSGFSRLPQAPSQPGTQNEYLPPTQLNGQPQKGKPESSAPGFTTNLGTSELNSSGQKKEQKDQIPDFVAFNRPKPGFASASASTSFGQSVFQPQPARPLNAFNTQTQAKPNQVSQQQSTQQTSQLSSQTPDQINSNSFQSSSFAAQTISVFGSKPTTVPDTELTTPLEPNETPTSQGSQFPSQTTSSISSFGSKPASNSQTQAQFVSQENSGLGQQSASHTLSPTFPTSPPITNSQFGATYTQSSFQSSLGTGPGNNSNGRPQISQNAFSQTQQHQGIDNSYYYNQPSKAFGTPAGHPQGSRFPSSPSYQSNEVASQNQQLFQSSTKFPGSLAPVGPTSTTQFAQSQGYNGITQAAISPFPLASPTPSSQFSSTQNSQFGTKPSFNQQSTFSNQAQLSATKPSYNQQATFGNQGHIIQDKPSFPRQPITGRFPPTSVGQENGNQENKFLQPINNKLPSRPISQFGQKPTLSQSTPESSDGSSQQQTLTQQYQGTIYQYNKPAEVLPASAQTDSSSSPTIQTVVISDSKPLFGQSQGNQLSSQQNTKPFSQASDAGSKFDAQSKPIGSVHLGQYSQTTHGSSQQETQFGSQPARPSNTPSSTNVQFSHTATFGDQPTKPFGTSTFTQSDQSALKPDSSSLQKATQGSQTGPSSKPFGSVNQGIQSTFGSKPQLGSQTTQFSQTTQSFGSLFTQPEKVSESQSHTSQTFQNTASSQENGYFYPNPQNPEPQFVENSKNQFSQNSQLGGSHLGPNQYDNPRPGNSRPGYSQTSGVFNQQASQLNSASKPQFGIQSQINQNTAQTTFSQKNPNSPIQPFNQPQFGQSTASSQAFALGPATASATASSSGENKPFGSQNKNQFSQTQKLDNQGQIGQGTQQFGSNTQEAPNSKPFGTSQGSIGASKPLFNSACCQSKDSIPAQSADRPSSTSFQGTQSFSAQSFSGKGEQFGGPRAPPSFDEQTGYHY